jgi:hypothetical protein
MCATIINVEVVYARIIHDKELKRFVVSRVTGRRAFY